MTGTSVTTYQSHPTTAYRRPLQTASAEMVRRIRPEPTTCQGSQGFPPGRYGCGYSAARLAGHTILPRYRTYDTSALATLNRIGIPCCTARPALWVRKATRLTQAASAS